MAGKRQPLEQRSKNWFDWIFDENARHARKKNWFHIKNVLKGDAKQNKRNVRMQHLYFFRFCLMGLQFYASHFKATKPSFQATFDSALESSSKW